MRSEYFQFSTTLGRETDYNGPFRHQKRSETAKTFFPELSFGSFLNLSKSNPIKDQAGRCSCLAGILTTLPFCQTTSGSPLRRCSSITFATATLRACSALRTIAGTLREGIRFRIELLQAVFDLVKENVIRYYDLTALRVGDSPRPALRIVQ